MVTMTDSVTNTIVKMRYLPSSGMASEVEGMISIRTRKKKVSDSKIEIDNVTFSPLSEGK